MKVVVMSGIPGSGKSTYVRDNFIDAKVFSADSFFMVDGEYRFDPSKLGAAHGACLRDFTEALQADRHECLVVDNTNVSSAEIAPYAALAQAYGAELLIVTMCCDPGVAAARNVHGVPETAVRRMYATMTADRLPPWWPHMEVES